MTNETDRELLELAAKAAGLSECGWMADTFTHVVDNIFVFWSPLDDDGDALRLAVRLAIDSPGARFEISVSKMYDGRGSCVSGFYSKDNPTQSAVDADIYAATRRAIVRAAAEIGKAMP